MRMRSHRRNLVVWSASAGPARRSHGDQKFTRLVRSGRIRYWLRTGALLTAVGITRLARTMRYRWHSAFLLTGALLTVIGVLLPSGTALVPGVLVFLFALLIGKRENDGRPPVQVAQLTKWHWHA